MECNCKSYNNPEWGGTQAEVPIIAPDWLSKPVVYVDECMAELVSTLWSERIATLSCCCGHRGHSIPHIVLAEADQVARAQQIIKRMRPDWPIQIIVWSNHG